jgi:uncharacterized protein (TIGR00255 family)
MTGYGMGEEDIEGKKYTLELRSLNGKITDLRLKLPSGYKELELPIRKYVLGRLERGKIEATLSVDGPDAEDIQFNEALFTRYYNELSRVAKKLGSNHSDIFSSLVRLPSVFKQKDPVLSSEDKGAVNRAMTKAVAQLLEFRKEEGKSIEIDLKKRISVILSTLDEVLEFEPERIERLKIRLNQNLKEYISNEDIDENRFEQEVLYYIEKLDLNEEKVRLKQHCKFFLEQLENEITLKGKKLGFISQEIGREINTLGSKAQHSSIQRCVVRMKDELEKIKEQIANTL